MPAIRAPLATVQTNHHQNGASTLDPIITDRSQPVPKPRGSRVRRPYGNKCASAILVQYLGYTGDKAKRLAEHVNEAFKSMPGRDCTLTWRAQTTRVQQGTKDLLISLQAIKSLNITRFVDLWIIDKIAGEQISGHRSYRKRQIKANPNRADDDEVVDENNSD